MNDKDKMILKKIAGYIDDIAHFVSGLDFDSFLADKKTISACAFVISQIGEIAGEVSDDFQMSHSTIPWKSIRGMRNKIVHDYEGIDFSVLWGTIKTSLPVLKEQLINHIENK
jgi:uncharacterized protein with HEPN domain